eukprot:2680917-Lingulodinium_polyedra.AAC.1
MFASRSETLQNHVVSLARDFAENERFYHPDLFGVHGMAKERLVRRALSWSLQLGRVWSLRWVLVRIFLRVVNSGVAWSLQWGYWSGSTGVSRAGSSVDSTAGWSAASVSDHMPEKAIRTTRVVFLWIAVARGR